MRPYRIAGKCNADDIGNRIDNLQRIDSHNRFRHCNLILDTHAVVVSGDGDHRFALVD